ncbi:MAG: SDR family oxidoreductase, partial [Anaerolineales bacterium]
AATQSLQSRYASDALTGALCDVTRLDDVQALWDAAVARFGRVDIWVNNAGAAHPQKPLWELDDAQVRAIFDANVHGLLNGVRVAVRGMTAQGGGQIYNFEGFGSNGSVRKGLGAYAASKAAVSLINRTLALELAGSPVRVASIQQGMVMTGLVLDQFADDPAGLEKVKPIFNIIASRVEEVAPVLARKMLAENKNGAHIRFLSGFGLMLRFLTAPFARRDVFPKTDR